jgi:hypothetical protein
LAIASPRNIVDIKEMLIIREATSADYKTITNIHTNNWQSSYAGILSDDYLQNIVPQER